MREPFTWFMGAVSLLNLLGNLDIARVRSDLFLWVESYGRVVERFGAFFFGWIDFWGLGVTASEMHLLVLFGLFCGAFWRTPTEGSVLPDWQEKLVTLGPTVLLFLLVVLVVDIDTWLLGLVALAPLLVKLGVATGLPEREPASEGLELLSHPVSGRLFLTNVVAVLMLAVAIVILDYSWFQAIG